jgi:hypothetical protein
MQAVKGKLPSLFGIGARLLCGGQQLRKERKDEEKREQGWGKGVPLHWLACWLVAH